jgi:hypothetical protein
MINSSKCWKNIQSFLSYYDLCLIYNNMAAFETSSNSQFDGDK